MFLAKSAAVASGTVVPCETVVLIALSEPDFAHLLLAECDGPAV